MKIRTSSRLLIAVIGVTSSLVSSGVALAEIPVLPPMPGGDPTMQQAAEGLAGVAMIGEDYYATISVGTALRFGKVGVGVQAPLRFRVIDNDPKGGGTLRKEDWDELGDYTKILRYVEYGSPGDPIYLRLGELIGTSIGNGTIIDRYYNTIDIDHYRTGLRFDFDTGTWGVQTMLSSLTTSPLVALRPYYRPLTESAIPILKTLTVGLTFAVDPSAPDALDKDASGNPVMDDKNNLQTQNKAAWLAGVGASLEVFKNDLIQIVPYVDLNTFELRGLGSVGAHIGTFINLHPVPGVLDLDSRWEYRRFGGHYLPGYVSTTYEIERVNYLGTFVPKAAFLRHATRDDLGVNGFYGSLDFAILQNIRVTGVAEKYDSDQGGNVMVRLLLPYIANLQFSAYYMKRGFAAFKDAFDPDSAMAIAALRYKIQGPLFLQGNFTRQWRAVADPTPRYETIDDFRVGVGVDFRF